MRGCMSHARRKADRQDGVSPARRNMLIQALLVFWLIRPGSGLPGEITSGKKAAGFSLYSEIGFTAARPRPVLTDFR